MPQRLVRDVSEFFETHSDQLPHNRLWQRSVQGEVEGTLGHRVTVKLICKLPEDRTTERQVAQMILERGEARDCLASYAEGGNPVRDHLLGVRDDLKNGAAQCLKRAALRLIDSPQILVNLLGGHCSVV